MPKVHVCSICKQQTSNSSVKFKVVVSDRVEAKLKAVLHINRRALTVQASIRHWIIGQSGTYAVGFEFFDLTERDKRILVAVVLDVQRRSFQKQGQN